MIDHLFKNKRIILASGSPRRQDFFKAMQIPFEIQIKSVDEVFPDDLKGHEITDYLAKLKASAFEGDLQPNDILVTSDTIVWFEDQAINKPENHSQAIDMLKKLSGKKHRVKTSVCLKTINQEILFHDNTTVKFVKLTDDEINYYVEQFKPFDKAGAYGIQEWIGLIGIKKIKGSYCNVVGLPTHKVFKQLKHLL
jgi:septum formation protein